MNKLFIDQVISCITATKFPQKPKNKMEMVLCDADFYHLCRLDYIVFERSLRFEWEQELKLVYTDKQWNALNLEMLKTHHYFTNYGQTVLQPLKLKHIQRIERQLNA